MNTARLTPGIAFKDAEDAVCAAAGAMIPLISATLRAQFPTGAFLVIARKDGDDGQYLALDSVRDDKGVALCRFPSNLDRARKLPPVPLELAVLWGTNQPQRPKVILELLQRIEDTAPHAFIDYLPAELRTAAEQKAEDKGGNSLLGIPLVDADLRSLRVHRPGEDPLPDERLQEIRATAVAPDVRDLLGELDRVRALLSTTLEANGTLLDNWARLEGVAPHPFLGVFCRTCRSEVQVGTEGCPRHSPTVISRALYAMHAENRSLLDAEEAGNRAVAMLDTALPLLAAVLNPVDHREGCRPHDCRCACDRRQNCQDCHRCVCWRSECCAEKAIRWHAEDRWARLVAEAGLEPAGSGSDAEGPKCAVCLTPIAEHEGRHCERPATRNC
ncbi:hypothetical protein [Streptomyces pseudovenezuelae]|uniref:hypothetical protein n=1 Tax=Streptomyces pseudovenezuelae TaxID=67350 RepID=UPI003712753E